MSATDKEGNEVSFSEITVEGTVDTNTPGEYPVTYSYGGVTSTAMITVEKSDVPVVNPDPSIPEIDFMNQKWDIIKGPAQMGAGNYLIAMQNSIGNSTFNNLRNGNYYFQENDPTLDGYQSPDNLVKPMVDDWYANNVSGTAYEQYVQPVVLNNPTLQTMFDAGWSSNTSGSVSIAVWSQATMGSGFNTVVGGSTKQAFMLGVADLTANDGTNNLTANALVHRDKLTANGVSTSWLRSPAFNYGGAASLYSGLTTVNYNSVDVTNDIVPSLVVTGIEAPTVEVNAITGNSTDGYTVTGVGSDSASTVSITDSTGNILGTGNVNSDGSYSVSISGTVGPNAQINVTASDVLGNVSDPATGTTPADATAIINLQPSTLIEGDKWDPASNFVSATDKAGDPVPLEEIAVSGEFDTSVLGEHQVTFTYDGVSETTTVTVVPNQTAVHVKDSSLVVGDTWKPEDNFVSATDKNGNPVDFTQIIVYGKVDTTTPGTYEVTYSYGGANSKATITVSKVEGNTPGVDPIAPTGPNTNMPGVEPNSPQNPTLPEGNVIPDDSGKTEDIASVKELPALNAKQSSLSFIGLLLLLGSAITTLGVKVLTRKKR